MICYFCIYYTYIQINSDGIYNKMEKELADEFEGFFDSYEWHKFIWDLENKENK